MNTRTLLLALVAIPLALVPPTVSANATLTLVVDANLTFPYDEPAFHVTCSLSVPDGADGGAVLDAAVSAGCIDGWAYLVFSGGRYVTSVTGADLAPTDERAPSCPGTIGYWGIWHNGTQASFGIDDYEATAGDELLFHYTVDDGCTFALTIASFFTGVRAASPVPLSGPL